MGTGLIIMLGTCVLVGVEAQAWKGRIGAGWGIFTTFMMFFGYLFIYFAMYGELTANYGQEYFSPDGDGWLVLALFISLCVGGFMALIVATLPNKKKLTRA